MLRNTHERLTPEGGRYRIDSSVPIATEVPLDPSIRSKAVVALDGGNKQVAEILETVLRPGLTEQEQRSLIDQNSDKVANQFVAFSLVLRTNPPTTLPHDLPSAITDNKGDVNFTPLAVYSVDLNREADIKGWIDEIADSEPNDLVYDFLSDYHPSLDAMSIPEQIELYQKYYEAIKKRLLHNGILLIQLDDESPLDTDSIPKMRSMHNIAIEAALSNAGFNINDNKVCTRYLYERLDGTKGTLYVIVQQDYAEGEIVPETDTAVRTPVDEEALAAIEMAVQLTTPATATRR